MDKLTIEAKTENFSAVREFIDEKLEKLGCKMKIQFQIDVAVEEIFVNIAHYAYEPDTGMAEIRFSADDDTATITFIDSGKPYNPLEKPDPDITLSADEREIGGLGILMVRKSMDDMKYEYIGGQNILSIIKKLN